MIQTSFRVIESTTKGMSNIMGRVKIAKLSYLISSAAVFALGIVFLICPGISPDSLCRAAGAVMLVLGAVKLYGYFSNDLYRIAFQFGMAFGTLSMILGAAMLAVSEKLLGYLPEILSVFVIVDSLFTVQNSIEAEKFGIAGWWMLLICGVLAAFAGGTILILQLTDGDAMRFTGVAFIADSIQNVAVAILTVHYRKKDAMQETRKG